VWLLWRLWTKPTGKLDFILVGLAFALLFQFELAAIPLAGLVLIYAWGKRGWLMAAIGILIGLIPQVIYDLTHGFKQLGLFGVWLGYRLVSFAGFDSEHTVSGEKLSLVVMRFGEYGQRYFSYHYPLLSALIMLMFGFWMIMSLAHFFKLPQKEKIVLGWLMLLIAGFFIHGGPSEAYFPALFVPVSIGISILIVRSPLQLRKWLMAIVFTAAALNSLKMYRHDYLVNLYSPPLWVQHQVIEHLSNLAMGRRVYFDGIGLGSEFASAVDNYRFLWQIKNYEVTQPGMLKVYFFLDKDSYLIPNSTVYVQEGVSYAVVSE
jgi:hypothetical protein